MSEYGNIEKIIQKDKISLSDHSTYSIGGTAGYFTMPSNMEELSDVLNFSEHYGLPYMVFGAGANILFPDSPSKDFLYISLKNMVDIRPSEKGLFVSAGFPLSLLSIAGWLLEDPSLFFTHLLPGSTGAGIYMNARCYDSSVCDVLDKIYYIELGNSNFDIKTIDSCDCNFSYKHSIFQSRPFLIMGADIKIKSDPSTEKNKNFITEISRIIKNENPDCSSLIKFHDFFRQTFRRISGNDNIPKKIKDIEDDRVMKKHFDFPSCGSFFKNNYVIGIPTGTLVDRLNLKGTVYGGAMVSPSHGNFILNYRNARASDVMAVMDIVSEAVTKAFNFTPEPEVVIVRN